MKCLLYVWHKAVKWIQRTCNIVLDSHGPLLWSFYVCNFMYCMYCLIVTIARILFKNSPFVFHRNNKSIWVWKSVSKWQNIPLIDAGPSPKRIGCTRGHYWCTQLIIPSLLGGTTPFHLQLSFYILFDNVWVLIWERHTDTLSSAGLMMASIFMLYIQYCHHSDKTFHIKQYICECMFSVQCELQWMRVFVLWSCSVTSVRLLNNASPL